MRPLLALALLSLAAPSSRTLRGTALPLLEPNPNTARAGLLRNGVLTVEFEARTASFRADGPRRPAMTIAALSEPGKAPTLPGPLVRAVSGTTIHLYLRNALPTPVTFFVPAELRGGPGGFAFDSMVVAPGARGLLTTRAVVPGNYVYRARTPGQASEQQLLTGAMAGGLVVDTVGTPLRAHDRVFVIMMTPDSARIANAAFSSVVVGDSGHQVFTINGRSWPSTERVSATVGDSLHWRIINATDDVHPMHLHGFYYRVDEFTGPHVARDGQGPLGRMVVTERMSPFSGMAMTWSPSQPGNWLFHCHFALHLMPDSISAPDDPGKMGMVGLILGIHVANRSGVHLAGEPVAARRLRLLAVADKGFPDSAPSMRFVLDDQGKRSDAGPGFSPTIHLTRGVPVSIMVVNQLLEATSVHWHGIEVEDSYVDGVAGFSGSGSRLAPSIAPGDSFEARFTPPRAGTFMYHTHMDDVKQEQAGMMGALIVLDPGTTPSPDDHVFFLKGSRLGLAAAIPIDVNGQGDPDTVTLRLDHAARLRFISLVTANPNATLWLTARRDSTATIAGDSMIVQWTPVAKDGADLPRRAQNARAARQIISMGETYDFAFTPHARGTLRLEIRAAGQEHQLLTRVPIVVR